MTRVTLETVTEAADSITARGEKPTVEAIRVALGGSPNTICHLLRAWRQTKAGQPAANTEVAQPEPAPDVVQDISSIEALPEVEHALDHLTATIMKTMTAQVERERAKAANTVQAVQSACDQKVSLARQAADQQVEDVQALAREAQAEADEMYAALSNTVETTEAERDALIGEVAQLECDIARLKDELDQARHDRDALMTQLASEKAKAAELSIQLDGAVEAKVSAMAETERLAAEMRDARNTHIAEIDRLHGSLADIRAVHAAELGRTSTLMEEVRVAHEAEITRMATAANRVDQALAEERAARRDEVARLTDQSREAGARAVRAEQRAEAIEAHLITAMTVPPEEAGVVNRQAPSVRPPAKSRQTGATATPSATAADADTLGAC